MSQTDGSTDSFVYLLSFLLNLIAESICFLIYVNSVSLHHSPLLCRPDQPLRDSDLPSPNLRPRHQELIPTPCGPVS